MKDVRLGLLGLGTVGAGVVKILQGRRESLEERAGGRLTLAAIADADLARPREGLDLAALPMVGDAARVLEDQVQASSFRSNWRQHTGRDATARDEQDAAQASQAAREEAAGAGVVLTSVYATVTVTDETDLPAAIADLHARADHSRLRVRPLSGGQAAGFCTTLGIGVHPADLAVRTWEQGGR